MLELVPIVTFLLQIKELGDNTRINLLEKYVIRFVEHMLVKGVGSGIKEYTVSFCISSRMCVLQLLLSELKKKKQQTLRFSEISY